LAVKGDTLYVADRKNHVVRELDLKAKTAKTIAGTGKQGHDRDAGGEATKIALNSPWDLLLKDRTLYIALAGHHQIWKLDLVKDELNTYAGTGRENILDGALDEANFAQPSGLTTDGKYLYVADSEVSAIRRVPLNGRGQVTTLVREGLFEFGDVTSSDALAAAIGVAEVTWPERPHRRQHAP